MARRRVDAAAIAAREAARLAAQHAGVCTPAPPPPDLAAALERIAAAGIRLGLTPGGDAIVYDAPAPLSPAQLDWLRAHKAALLVHLRAQAAPPPPAPDIEAIAEALAERAAIQECDGGLPRAEAEQSARAAMRAYHVLVAMDPGQAPRWVTLILPGCDLAQARTAVTRRWPGRVLDLRGADA